VPKLVLGTPQEIDTGRAGGSCPPPYRGRLSDPSQAAGSRSRSHGGWTVPASSVAGAEAWDKPSDAVLEVYDITDEFAEHVPPKFAKLVAVAAALEIEGLDI